MSVRPWNAEGTPMWVEHLGQRSLIAMLLTVATAPALCSNQETPHQDHCFGRAGAAGSRWSCSGLSRRSRQTTAGQPATLLTRCPHPHSTRSICTSARSHLTPTGIHLLVRAPSCLPWSRQAIVRLSPVTRAWTASNSISVSPASAWAWVSREAAKPARLPGPLRHTAGVDIAGSTSASPHCESRADRAGAILSITGCWSLVNTR